MKYERIKFLVLALKNAVEVYAWAPKPYHKFMAFKVSVALLQVSFSQRKMQVDPTNLIFCSRLVIWCTSLCWWT